jgi:surface protein
MKRSILLTILLAAVPCFAINDPVAHWKLDETSGTTAADSAGSNNGTLVNMTGSEWTTGQIGGALEFDGVDDYVNVPITYHNGEETMSFWIKTTSTELSYFRQVDSSDMYRIYFNNSIGGNGSIQVLIQNSGTSDSLNGYVNTNVNNGLWNHVAIVTKLATNEIEIYINGVSKAVTYGYRNSPSYPLSFTSTNLFGGPPDRYFDGSVDDVRIYDRALSSSEISELAGLSNEPIAHWKLDETSGTTAADSAGSNDGTLVNMTGSEWTTGQIDGALDLDGVDDYVEVGDTASLSNMANITISTWINPDTLPTSSGHRIISKWTPTDKEFIIKHSGSIGSGEIVVGFYAKNYSTTNYNLPADSWTHLCVVWDGTQFVKVYKNGILNETVTLPGTPSPSDSDAPTVIGKHGSVSTEYFEGHIDDVRIYDRVLSSEEVAQLYYKGFGNLSVTPIEEFISSDKTGGSFAPASKDYQLTNIGDDTVWWDIQYSAGWLDVSDTTGALGPNEFVTVTVSINANADNLSRGIHSDTMTFRDITDPCAPNNTQILPVTLTIISPCPFADHTGDCRVDLKDFAVIGADWLGEYDLNEVILLANQWLDDRAFVTTWDTSKEAGTTVTLALTGTVNATINWGDGSAAEHVTTSGPHVHDYGTDGIYIVSVTGSATAYNSYERGGAISERGKLISVDDWGNLGFTSMDAAFDYCDNLVSVPTTSEGIEAVTNMIGMFAVAESFNSDIGGWDTSNVTDMTAMFAYADSFNQDIGGWDTSSVTDMGYMFYDALAFNQDLSGWCVTNIPSYPMDFSLGANSWTLPRPDWGEPCP